MSDGHHEILLLILHIDLSSNSPVNKNSSHEDQSKESGTFSNILGSFCFLLIMDAIYFFLVERVGRIQFIQTECCHFKTLVMQCYEPPDKCSYYIYQQDPVNGIRPGESFFLKSMHLAVSGLWKC